MRGANQERSMLPEREARAIVVQIISALVYMNTKVMGLVAVSEVVQNWILRGCDTNFVTVTRMSERI